MPGFFVSSVTPANQTSIRDVRVELARYLNGMHKRIHPVFSECFLDSLRALPPADPRNDSHLTTRLEIVIRWDGRIRRMGVVRSSGLAAFDIGALDTVDRAQPFEPPSNAVRSRDGNVYVQWEFHRDETLACSTIGAQPFLLQ